jgi:hypothetical protein
MNGAVNEALRMTNNPLSEAVYDAVTGSVGARTIGSVVGVVQDTVGSAVCDAVWLALDGELS